MPQTKGFEEQPAYQHPSHFLARIAERVVVLILVFVVACCRSENHNGHVQ